MNIFNGKTTGQERKLGRSQNSIELYSTPIYLFIYYMNIQNVSSSRLYNRLQSVDGLLMSACLDINVERSIDEHRHSN